MTEPTDAELDAANDIVNHETDHVTCRKIAQALADARVAASLPSPEIDAEVAAVIDAIECGIPKGAREVTIDTRSLYKLSAALRSRPPAKQEPKPSDWRKLDHDEPATYPTSGTRVLFVGTGAFDDAVLCLGEWDADRERWFDVETDGDNDRIEFAPGEVTHWRPLPPLPGAAIQAMGEATRTGEAEAVELVHDFLACGDWFDPGQCEDEFGESCRMAGEHMPGCITGKLRKRAEAFLGDRASAGLQSNVAEAFAQCNELEKRTGEALGMAREIAFELGVTGSGVTAAHEKARALVLLLERETAGGK